MAIAFYVSCVPSNVRFYLLYSARHDMKCIWIALNLSSTSISLNTRPITYLVATNSLFSALFRIQHHFSSFLIVRHFYFLHSLMIKWFAFVVCSFCFSHWNRHQERVFVWAAVKESIKEEGEKMNFIIRSIIKAGKYRIQGSDVCDIESNFLRLTGWLANCLVGWLVIYLLVLFFLIPPSTVSFCAHN